MSQVECLEQESTRQRTGWLPLAIDLLMYAFLLAFGAFQVTHYLHTADFVTDTDYPDLARAIVEHGRYEFAFTPETTLPPGLPAILALVGLVAGISPATLFPVIALSSALGLLLTYEFLRRIEGRVFAAAVCLLVASNPTWFGFAAVLIFPEMPYIFASMLVLLLALQLDREKRASHAAVQIFFISIGLLAAVLIRSVGVALLAALVAWIAFWIVKAPAIGRRRLKLFALPLLLGIAAQTVWTAWAQAHQHLEWQLPGYPESYVAQLKIKDGQHPELGFARLSDLPSRVERNLVTRTEGYVRLLVARHVSHFWSSPAIAGVVLLVLLGLVCSLRDGGELHAWYFVFYEAIFLVWPWDYRDRFVYPVLPLFCVYVWRGVKKGIALVRTNPRRAGVVCTVAGGVLCLVSGAFATRLLAFQMDPGHVRGDRLQTIAATLFWACVAAGGLLLARGNFYHLLISRFSRLPLNWQAKAQLAAQAAGLVLLATLITRGLAADVRFGRELLHPDITKEAIYPEIEAAEWVKRHEPATSVLMARDRYTIFHYTNDHVIWFPPISNPETLMAGIRRYHVDTLIVAFHPTSYWLPPEDACFRILERAYPGTFRLIHKGPGNEVFRVASPPA